MSIGVRIGKGSSWMVRCGDERKGGGESGMSSVTSSAEKLFWDMGDGALVCFKSHSLTCNIFVSKALC